MCSILDPISCAEDMVNSVVGGAIEDMANAVIEGVGKVIASFGTMWVNIGTPVLTGGDGGASAGADAGFSAPVLQVLGYITWIGYAVAIIAIIALASITTVKVRRGEGMLAVGRLGIILAAVILIGGASGLVAGLLPSGPVGAGGAVAFLQGSLWWIMLAVAVGATIVGAIRMAVTMRAEPGKDVFFGLLRLIVVAGAGVGIVALLVTAADAFSVWIIDRSTDCNLSAGDSTCFGRNISNLLVLTTTGTAGAPGLGALLVIILGVIAIIVAVVQIILMLARGGMLVVLTGILPLSAAAAMSGESGKGWFNKNVAWLVAFILYKPAAAIIYAAAFQLAGTDVFKDDGTGLISVITGLMMMLLALVALPALMRFVTPMVGAMAGGAGGGMIAAAGVAAVPSGAAQVGRLAGGAGGGSTASPSTAGATGSTGTAGSQGQAGAAAASRGGAAAGGGGAAAGGGVAAAGGGAAAAGGGAAAGASAGAAAGPWGAAAGAAVGAAKQVGDAAKGAAEKLGDQATGEGPSGNR
ncbi:hypothetical protein JM654_04325 [Microbacterium oxydans]|nr:hypothetical protein [Microbacterium oxydans]